MIPNIRKCITTLYRGDARVKQMVDVAVGVEDVNRLVSNVKAIKTDLLKLCQLT